jgi:nicotinamidase-related amidase
MSTTTYAADRTALLIVDPYNDFMSEGGKFYEATKDATAAGRHARGARGQWAALRARYSDHRGAAGPAAVLIQATDVVVA